MFCESFANIKSKELQVKGKKLLISLVVVPVAIVAFIVVLIAVFAVDDVTVRYHDFDGREIVATQGEGVAPKDILKLIKGKSTVLLSKTNLLEQLNKEHSDWHAFAVVKNFPNDIEVHFVKRTVIAKVNVNGLDVYVDSFGYVTELTSDNCVDISSAFPEGVEAQSSQPGSPLTFKDAKNDVRFKCVLDAIMATWRCKVEVEYIPQVLGNENVFEFVHDDMIIHMPKGSTIRVIAPETKLSDRLIEAYSVYYNKSENLQNGAEIVVHKSGKITTKGNK